MSEQRRTGMGEAMAKAMALAKAENQPAKRRYRETAPSMDVFKELVDACNGKLSEAARLIGMTPSGLNNGMNKGNLSLTAAIAAKGVLDTMRADKAEPAPVKTHLVVTVPTSKLNTITDLLIAMDCDMHVLKTNGD